MRPRGPVFLPLHPHGLGSGGFSQTDAHPPAAWGWVTVSRVCPARADELWERLGFFPLPLFPTPPALQAATVPHTFKSHRTHGEVRRHLCGLTSPFLPSREFQGLNSGHHTRLLCFSRLSHLTSFFLHRWVSHRASSPWSFLTRRGWLAEESQTLRFLPPSC